MPLNASWSWTPVPSTAPEFSTVGVTGIWFGGLSHGVLTVSDTDVGDVLGLTGPTAVIATPLVDGRGTNNSTGVTTPFVGLAATSAAIIALSQPNVFVAGAATGTDFTISAIALDTQGTDSVDTDVWFSPITASSDGGGAVTGWIAGYQDQGTLYFGETSSPTLASGTSWNDSDWAQGWEDDGCFALAGDDFDAATGFYATSDGNTLYAFASDPTQALCVSVNGGATWTPVALETGAGVSAFGFHEGGAGVVAGGGGPGIDSGSTPPIAYFTTSGGTTESGWTASSLPTFGGVGQDQTALTFTNVFFADADHVWIFGSYLPTGEDASEAAALLFASTDGGRTFADQSETLNAALATQFAIPPPGGAAGGYNVIPEAGFALDATHLWLGGSIEYATSGGGTSVAFLLYSFTGGA
jgi:hypothetical protein